MPKLSEFTYEQIVHWKMLRAAVKGCDVSELKFLIEDYPDIVNEESNLINAVAQEGNSLGHLAAGKPEWTIFGVLGFYGADFSIKNGKDQTPSDLVKEATCYNPEEILGCINGYMEKYYRPLYLVDLNNSQQNMWKKAVLFIKEDDAIGLERILKSNSLGMDVKTFMDVRGGRVQDQIWHENLAFAAAHYGAGESVITVLDAKGADFVSKNKYGISPLSFVEEKVYSYTETANFMRNCIGNVQDKTNPIRHDKIAEKSGLEHLTM